MFALADCNNFYASCERVFQPKLIGKPIVVLSNNDGCIIARSQEAKDIGIPMGAPVFKASELIEKHDVKVFSANFTLYGDMSHRVMRILNEYIARMEIYSIDEAFLAFDGKVIERDFTEYGLKIRGDVLKSTGIPVSIGIAPTKVLSKICNHHAKKNKSTKGVFSWTSLDSERKKAEFLHHLPVGEVWGIGYRTTYKMNELGIYNALQLRDANQMWLRKNFSVSEQRISTELRETSCLPLENTGEPRKNIMSSRSFGRPVETIEELEEAVSVYITRGAEKLREQKSLATYVYVSIKTNKHRPELPQYFNYVILPTEYPTAYNPDLIKTALKALRQIYKLGFKYKKATIMLLGLMPDESSPLNLFVNDEEFKLKKNLMGRFDSLNSKYGREVIKYASTGVKQGWRDKRESCSPQYTTNWNELLKIK